MGLKIRNWKVGGFFSFKQALYRVITLILVVAHKDVSLCPCYMFLVRSSLFSPQGKSDKVLWATEPEMAFHPPFPFPPTHRDIYATLELPQCMPAEVFFLPFSCCYRWRCTSFPQLMVHLLQLWLSRRRTQPPSNLPKSAVEGLGCPQLWSSMVFPLCQPLWNRLW